jgi:hypothetical protein
MKNVILCTCTFFDGRRCAILSVRTGYALILSPILLLLFVWFQAISKNNTTFLWFLYSSFIFLASATLLLISFDTKHASRGLKRLSYALTIIALLVVGGVAFSIATFPAGGTMHYFSVKPKDVEIDLTYGTYFDKTGYYGGIEQAIINPDYPVGGAFIYYDLYGLHVFTNKSVVSNVTLWFSFYFWPNQREGAYNEINRMETATALHNGTESSFSFGDHTLIVEWGSPNPSTPGLHDRLGKGYRVTIYVAIEFEGPDYGSLKATIPFTESVYGNDVEVSSQLEDGIAVFLCGIFVAALLSLPAKRMKPKIAKTLTPISNRANRFFGTEPAPRSFFKGCGACGKEIPIASEECQYCGAKQDIESAR